MRHSSLSVSSDRFFGSLCDSRSGGTAMLALGTCLWFDTQAEEAAKFYVSIFPNSKITATSRYPDGPPDPKRAGQVLTVAFVLDGREFMGLNGGPLWPF